MSAWTYDSLSWHVASSLFISLLSFHYLVCHGSMEGTHHSDENFSMSSNSLPSTMNDDVSYHFPDWLTWQSVKNKSHTLCKHRHDTVGMWTVSCDPREEDWTIVCQLLYPGRCWLLQIPGPVRSQPWWEHFSEGWPQLLAHYNIPHSVTRNQLINLLHTAQSLLRSWSLLTYSKNSPPSTDPDGSLPCSQMPTTGPFTEADEFSPRCPNLFLQD
jgi:hypothetical protein